MDRRCVERLEDSLVYHIEKHQRTGEELSRSLVHQHGTHCPTTLKTAALLLSCLNDHFCFSKYYHIECINDVWMLMRYKKFTFIFRLHYGKTIAYFKRLIRLVFVMKGLFKSINWNNFLNIFYIRKKLITWDYIHISLQTHWPVVRFIQ